MHGTWVVVAHRAGARMLEYDRTERRLNPVEELDNPQGRLRSSQLDTDRPGRGFSRAGRGGGHPMPSEEDAHHRAASDFAREIASALRAWRNENRFDELVLVAEPGFLGLLNRALDRPTASCVSGTVPKDLAGHAVRDLGPHLSSVLRVDPEPRLGLRE